MVLYSLIETDINDALGWVLTFHAYDLLQGMHYFDQVVLMFHHRVDVFVGGGQFIDNALVFPAFHAFRLPDRIILAKLPFGCGAAHCSACAMGTGTE